MKNTFFYPSGRTHEGTITGWNIVVDIETFTFGSGSKSSEIPAIDCNNLPNKAAK